MYYVDYTDIKYCTDLLEDNFKFHKCKYPYTRYALNYSDVVLDLRTNKIVIPTKGEHTPYVGLSLIKDGDRKTTTITLHRLKAHTFLENKTGLKFEDCHVDHIDGNKLNNDLDNLEIVTPKENKARAYRTGLRTDNDPTILINKDTNEEFYFYSQSEAARFLGTSSGSISYHISRINNTDKTLHNYYIRSKKQTR